ncbi:MAG: type I-E CRISPR-associated protein Cse1/CasA, partial [Gallionella sp.]
MKFNLIDEKWIPVKRKDGTPDRIRPWEVTGDFEKNPVVALDAPRPDFNGALIQFLIGLVQTTFAPTNRIEWKQKLRTPPSPDQLKAAFITVHHAFELGGDGARFMQVAVPIGKLEPVETLLIDTPGQKTCNDNKDHFVKRNRISAMCPGCSASAIITLHCNASAGGRGYMTSLRGGGPLTTLVIGDARFDCLWQTIWLNVLENSIFLNMCNSGKNALAESFPWLGNIKAKLTEQDIHPSQYYWAMPRRVRLDLDNLVAGHCDICSQDTNAMISKCQEEPNGIKYVEPMKHPLSPYNANSTKAVLTQP